jgi:hypothetical protein
MSTFFCPNQLLYLTRRTTLLEATVISLVLTAASAAHDGSLQRLTRETDHETFLSRVQRLFFPYHKTSTNKDEQHGTGVK